MNCYRTVATLMNYLRVLFFACFGALCLPTLCYAQADSPSSTPSYQRELTPEERQKMKEKQDEDAAKACAVCGGGAATAGVLVIVFVVVMIAINIALLVWVARDAKSRGMDSSVLWMLLVMFTSIIGLIIYLFARPQGQLVQCPKCGGKRLAASALCPHCHNP
jgi:hypothetical protein